MSDVAAGHVDPASSTQLLSSSDYMSVSDSTISPQTPRTPQLYSRTRPRYPQELGRVPLHRRGTSKTYERLEDLLKEAGYKETRIFTPETDRTRKCEDDDDDETVVEDKRTSMVKDVVGFLAGLFPGVGASVAGNGAESVGNKLLDPSAGSHPQAIKDPSPPSSPLPIRPTLSRHEQRPHVNRQPSQSQRPQIVVHPTTPGQHHHSYHGPPASHHSHHPHKQQSAHQQRLHGPGLTSASNIHLASPHTTTNVHSPRPSRATAYLRHMASAPNVVPNRPSSTPADVLHFPRSRSGLTVSMNNEQQPPLPASWLETVAKAVLFGGAGAHVGGPLGSDQVTNVVHHHPRTSPVRYLRPSRSSLSQVSNKSRYYSHHQHRSKKSPLSTGLSDSTNFTPSTATSSAFLSPGHPLVPPALFAQLERGRADRCVSEVCLAQVTCRSAPGSRSGSVVRSEGVGAEKNRQKHLGVVEWGVETEREREGRGRNRSVKRRGGREKEKLRVPSLARMHVEGDVWSSNMKTRKRSRPEPESVVGIGPGFGKRKAGYTSEVEVVEYDSYEDESDEDEEGELDLARMLIPPKRQNSIRSLQKHLLASVVDGKSRRVHHSASGANGGEGPKSIDGRLRQQPSHLTSLVSPNDADEEREDEEEHIFWRNTRPGNGVRPNEGRLKFLSLNPAGEDGENVDVDGKRGFGRDPMGSGRSSMSGKRLGIGSVWGGGGL